MKRKLLPLLFILICGKAVYSQTMQMHGFANVDGIATFSDSSSHNNNFFKIGQYDFFISGQPTEKISFLGESVFEWDGDFAVDVERLIIKYQINNHFDISAGKFHSPLGFWNNAYHHGPSIQPITFRPDPIRFEDDGGILPVHETGVELNGEHFTKANLAFNILVSNGISSTPVSDDDNHKAVTAQVSAEPVEHLKLIVSGYEDHLHAGAMSMQGYTAFKSGDMTILNGSIAYTGGKFPLEFIGEYYNIANHVDSVGARTTTALVGYIGYHIKKFTPYVCYTSSTYGAGQTYFTKNNSSRAIIGIRYRFSVLAVLKLEYQFYQEATMPDTNIAYLQFAIGF